MISIRKEIDKIENGTWPQDKNQPKHAPHTEAGATAAEWDRLYSREVAVFQVVALKTSKYGLRLSVLTTFMGIGT